MVREEGFSSLGRGIGPNVFRAVLMNASQLASYVLSFDQFNSENPFLSPENKNKNNPYLTKQNCSPFDFF